MRLPMFLAVVAVAFAASYQRQQYTDPTFMQVGRTISAVNWGGVGPSTCMSAVVRPYYARGFEEHADALLAQCTAE